ncbi:MAG: hypothetical protein ACI395_05830, partial [Candidatus Cryptobacteroides sp.]
MKKTYIISAVLGLFLAAGCVDNSMKQDEFVSTADGISLTINGKTVMSYQSGKHQCGFNDKDATFRISDDNFSNFFVVDCKGKVPGEVGETIEASLTYTTDNDILTKSCQFTV